MEDRKFYGCGFEGFDGKSQHLYEKGALNEPTKRTCPRFCSLLPHVQFILNDVYYFKKGVLGNILNLESAYVDYLVCAEYEMSHWENANKSRINKQIEAKRGK
jgi:hypothetical protein